MEWYYELFLVLISPFAIFFIICASILSAIFLYILRKIKKSNYDGVLIETLEDKYNIEKKYLFEASITLDLVGMISYILPGIGEISDIIFAPTMAIFLFFLYRNYNKSTRKAIFGIMRKNNIVFLSHIFGSGIYFFEELFTPFDIIPSATILWYYTFNMEREENKEVFLQKVSFYESPRALPPAEPAICYTPNISKVPNMAPPCIENKSSTKYNKVQFTPHKKSSLTSAPNLKTTKKQTAPATGNLTESLIKKAQSGDITSIMKLADIYINKGDEKSANIAFKLLQYAASQKSYIAHTKLGILYLHKKYKFYNYESGVKHLKIAAAHVPQARLVLNRLSIK